MTKEAVYTIRLEDGTYIHENSRCPKCDSKTLERSGEDLHCWSCGTTFYNKPRDGGVFMKHAELMKRHKFYEDNKQAILADVGSIGRAATAKKWNISPGSFYQVLERWKTEELKDKTRHTGTGLEATTVVIILPPFPPFSNEWDPKVQERWLDIYEVLAIRLPKGEKEKR